MNIPVLIPAYQPDAALLSVAEGLLGQGFEHIVIVNDGSGAAYDHIFGKLARTTGCRVIHHAVNLGKGRALKTGFNYCYLNFPDAIGFVTVDADGQHLPEDVMKVARTFLVNPQRMVIGSRVFAEGTPLRSRFGNILTRYVFRLLVGKKLSDTQSGLRCIPGAMLPDLIRLDGEKYEYEMNMLISTKTGNIDIVEQPITTVYIENNKSSHFNPLIDSMKIYFVLLRFSFSSVLASAIDFVVFSLVYLLGRDILTSLILARLVSGGVNFAMNRSLVFRSSQATMFPLIKYFILFVVLAGLSYVSIRSLAGIGMNVILAKILSESILFVASFAIQRDFVFVDAKSE